MTKVGITGHRNLTKERMVCYRARVREMLVKLQKEDKDICVYSALAEGADRLVVEVALELGVGYVAVLPMPREIYVTDYNRESRLAYDRLLDTASSVVEMSLVEDSSLFSITDYSEQRDLQYEAAGFYISDHCDVLMALWDGKYTLLRGGTSEIVKRYLSKTHYSLYHLQVSRGDGLTEDMVEFKIYQKK